MNVEKTIINARRNKIRDKLLINKKVFVNNLAKMYNVSPLTIRRDLEQLEKEGVCKRVYGGAQLVVTTEQSGLVVSENASIIAKYAASLIEEDDIIFINTSTTALKVLDFIDKKCVIITNNGKAIHINKPEGVMVFLTGGELRNPKESLVGEYALDTVNKVTVNKSFLGISGISAEKGLTTHNMSEVPINEAMLNNTEGTKYILTTERKLGKNDMFISGNIDSSTVIITHCDYENEGYTDLVREGYKVINLKAK